MKGGKQKIGKPRAGSLKIFLTTDGIRMGGRIDPMHSGGIFNREGGKEKMKAGK
jgi:hypothetical protein